MDNNLNPLPGQELTEGRDAPHLLDYLWDKYTLASPGVLGAPDVEDFLRWSKEHLEDNPPVKPTDDRGAWGWKLKDGAYVSFAAPKQQDDMQSAGAVPVTGGK